MRSEALAILRDRTTAALAGAAARILFRLPDPVLRCIGGGRPAEAPDLAPDAWILARLTSPPRDRDPEPVPVPTGQSRRSYALFANAVSTKEGRGVLTFDRTVPGPDGPVALRIYRPDPFCRRDPSAGPAATGESLGETGPLPAILYLHGGGWAYGSLHSHDRTCRRLARLAGAAVIAADYRLAPEHPWPAGLEDVLSVWRKLGSEPTLFGIDPARIGIAGDSAGANLAAATCLALKQAGEDQPRLQLLLYPALDLAGHHPSADTFAEGFRLTDADMAAYKDMYLPAGTNREDPLVSPLLADDLSGLAPAHIFTALADPLRDEGEKYFRRLHESGVEATLDRIPSIHGWFNMTVMRSSRVGFDQVVSRLRHTFTIAR